MYSSDDRLEVPMSTDEVHAEEAPGAPEVLPALPDVDDVEPLSENDRACMEDLRRVLEKHGALSRFGIMLLHRHFALADDEALVEFVDVDTRTLTTRPVKAADWPAENAIETNWRLDSQTSLQRCEKQCAKPYGPNGQHIRQHFTTG